jgi:hypothetical protein
MGHCTRHFDVLLTKQAIAHRPKLCLSCPGCTPHTSERPLGIDFLQRSLLRVDGVDGDPKFLDEIPYLGFINCCRGTVQHFLGAVSSRPKT